MTNLGPDPAAVLTPETLRADASLTRKWLGIWVEPYAAAWEADRRRLEALEAALKAVGPVGAEFCWSCWQLGPIHAPGCVVGNAQASATGYANTAAQGPGEDGDVT